MDHGVEQTECELNVLFPLVFVVVEVLHHLEALLDPGLFFGGKAALFGLFVEVVHRGEGEDVCGVLGPDDGGHDIVLQVACKDEKLLFE